LKRKRDKKERLLSKEYLVKFLFAFTIGTASGIVIMMLILKEEFTFLNYLLRFTPMLVGGILGTIIMYLIYIYDKRFM
jgi:hypothetical protein